MGKIIDFRNDEEARRKLVALRRWINKFAVEKRTIAEIEDEIEFLVNEYHKSLQHHRMKMKIGILEAFMKAPLDIAENVLKFKFSQTLNVITSIKKEKDTLYETEKTLIGRELSYILLVREKFRSN